MYRILLPILLCTSAVVPAPQSDSKITYVKIQPTINTKPRISRQTANTESKIQNIPLAISNSKPQDGENQPLIDPIEINDSAESPTESFHTVTSFTEDLKTESISKTAEKHVDEFKQEKTSNNQSTSIFDPHEINESAEHQTESELEANHEDGGGDKPDSPGELFVESPSDTVLNVKSSDISAVPTGRSLNDNIPVEKPLEEKSIDSLPSASISENRFIYATTSSIGEITTTLTNYEITDPTVPNSYKFKPKPRKPAPKFFPKLSYFKKSEDLYGGLSTNFIQRGERKKYKSNCRCEKIWNCPRLQITVPRCPNEYFLCCF